MNEDNPYEKLSIRIMTQGSKLIPELFRMVADEEAARLMLATPGTVEELAEKLCQSQEAVEETLNDLFRKGVVFKSSKKSGTKYSMCRHLVQFHDASILWPEAPQAFLALWKRYMTEEWPGYAEFVTQMIPKPYARVIPVNQDLQARHQILAYEDIKEIINNSSRVAVANCTCRLIDGACDKPLEVCLQVGKGADYTIERGSGREVTKEEAMDIVRLTEEAGLIHVTMNRSDESHFICNCCSDCCQAFGLMVAKGLELNLCDPSRFMAVVDQEKCSGCGTCQDRCFFGALSLVETGDQKISTLTPQKCLGCGLCMVTCSQDAISLKEVRQRDFIPTS